MNSTKVDAIFDLIAAYEKPNGSTAQAQRVINALRTLGFEGDDLMTALRVVGWGDNKTTAMAQSETRHSDYVVTLNFGHGIRYLADKRDFDGGWYTANIGNAKRYKRKANAERCIADHDWSAFDPKVQEVERIPERT